MHRSGEGQGSSAHAPPTSHAVGALLQAEQFAGQVRGRVEGAPEGPSATLPPSLLFCSAGWCVQVAGAEKGRSRSLGPGRSGRAAGAGFGDRGEAAPGPPLHGGLAAEDNLQVLAVELPRLSQGHDALSVVGELLDIHFLGDRRNE